MVSLNLFAFIFATPLAALLAAVGAASVPIIIHLLNRKRYRIVTWAAMRFLLAAQRKNARRMRLEQWILLAVRTLSVILLVAAMASVMPWAEALGARLFPGHAVLDTSGSRRIHKILVLDGSLSMSAKVGDANCFERARAIALKILHDSSGGDGFSVVLMSAPPRAVVPEPSDDARKVADEIQTLRTTHGNSDFVATLRVVEGILGRSPTKFEDREVYFLTDVQRSTWTARQSVDPITALQQIQDRARTILVDVGQDGINNLAVTQLALGVSLATTGGVTPITATIHNYGSELRKEVPVELLVGRARSAANEPAFALRSVAQIVADIGPGQSTTISFSHKFTIPGEYALQVRLESDRLEVDDMRTVTVSVKDTVPVLLVNGKPAVEPFQRATEFLLHALNPFQKGLVPRDIPARPKVVTESQFADAGLGDLTPYDCVFLCDVARLNAAEIRRLETHLRRGGGVVFGLGPRVDLETYNRLLYRNGEGILPARLLSLQRAPDKRPFTFYADEESYRRPPLDAFASDTDKASLMFARFRQYVRAELPPRQRAQKILAFMPETPSSNDPAPKDAELLPVSDPAIVAWQPPLPGTADRVARGAANYRGRVVLVTSTLNMDWTSWPVSPSYPALMQEILRYAIAGRLNEQAIQVGDILEEHFPLGGAGLEATVTTPDDGRPETVSTVDRDDGIVWSWADTQISGVYRMTVGRHPREYLYAVNVPVATDAQQACESDLTRTNREELRSAYPGWEFQVVADPDEVVRSDSPPAAATPRTGRGIGTLVARYAMLAMLGLFLMEVVLAWYFGHYQSSTTAMPVATPASSLIDRFLLALPVLILVVVVVPLFAVLLHAMYSGDLLGFLPDQFRRSVELGMGIPPPAAGEGSRWRLEFNTIFWSQSSDPWSAGFAGVLAVGLVALLYPREGSTAGKGYKRLLAMTRIAVVLLTLGVLLPQLRLWFERQGFPDVVLLIDDSRSMSASDRYQDSDVKEAAERLAKAASLANPERLQLAQALLTRGPSDWLTSLLQDRKVKVHVYHCSGRAARLGDLSDRTEVVKHDALKKDIQDLQATGESSQLGTSIRQVLNDFRGSSLSAIVTLTDGVNTEGEDIAKIARYARQVGVPLFFVGIGDSHEMRDLQLHDLQVEDSVYVNDRLVFEARLTSHGYPDLTVPVTLKEKGKPNVLAQQMVKIDPNGKPVKVRLTHQPTEPGEKIYVIEVPKLGDEVPTLDNNRLERSVFVREAKLNKVLYIEGIARYEFRFIKHLLERESSEDRRNKTIDLKVLLLDAGDEYARQDKSALAEFPTKAELNQFDVVILGDVDPKHPKMGEKRLVELSEFVRERGGGLLMIAGENFSPHAYRDGSLKDILPIEPTMAEQEEVEHHEGYHPELTPMGRSHPIFRMSPDDLENATIWSRLPEIFWWSEGFRMKPAAEVLAIHPGAAAARERAEGNSKERQPLIVQQFVGSGRCLFYGMNETWRWRYRDNELRFNQFWIQTVRYLARSRLGRVELRLDRQTPYRRGEPIKITVRFPDDSPPPLPETEVKVFVERTLPAAATQERIIDPQTVTLAKLEGSRATYETILSRTPEGEYRFWLSAPSVTGPKPRAETRVLVPPGELDRLRMNREDMERAAEETQGRFFTLADADRVLDVLPTGSRVALSAPQPPRLLWNHATIFGLVLVLLGSEWLLRKRKHLL